jgi:hypothetical protein
MLTRSDDDLRVSLVTFGRGDEIHQYWGHNALMVEDTAAGIGVLYNFGMFGFGPDMLTKYLRGQLEFWVAATPVESTFRHYQAENRSIRVSELHLSPTRRRSLAERLALHALPENRTYLYDHYLNNCSTKLRDLIDAAVDGQLDHEFAGPARLTWRGHTRRYTQQDPIVHMALLLWMNDSMERPLRRFDEAFLPDELERLVAEAEITDEQGHRVPLLKRSFSVFEAVRPPVPESPSRGWPELLAAGGLAGAMAIALAFFARRSQRWARALLGLHHAAIGLIVGVPGLVAFLGLFTAWAVTKWNENLFLASPLTLLAFPLGLAFAAGSERARRWLGVVWVSLGASTLLLIALKALPSFDQDTHLPLALLGPINVGCAVAHLWLGKRSQRAGAPARAVAPMPIP